MQIKQILERVQKKLTNRREKTTAPKGKAPTIDLDEAKELYSGVLKVLCMKESFVVDNENKDVLAMLVEYFTFNPLFENRANKLALKKGIILMGNVGSGKTLLMQAIKEINFPNHYIFWHTCIEMSDAFLAKELAEIHIASRQMQRCPAFTQDTIPNQVMFDDMGAEDAVYGIEVMDRIIATRYELYQKCGIRTYFTTNLLMPEIEKRYGSRVVSRLKEMCNLIMLGGTQNANDRRELA